MPIKSATGRTQEFDDATMLEDGRVIFSRMSGAAMLDAQKKIVCNYDAPPGTEVHSCQYLGKDRVLIMRNGNPAEAMVHQVMRQDAEHEGKQTVSDAIRVSSSTLYLRAKVDANAVVTYSFSLDGTTFQTIGVPFIAKPGRWVGARVGLFAISPPSRDELGYADYDWFRFSM